MFNLGIELRFCNVREARSDAPSTSMKDPVDQVDALFFMFLKQLWPTDPNR